MSDRAGRKAVRAALAIVVLSAFLVTAPPSPIPGAGAGPADNFALTKVDNVGGEALIGENITYTLEAAGSQASGANLYNLSFRDVLPVGVSFVSADPAPTEVLADVPAPGQTTVIWENVSDLLPNTRSSVSLTIDTNPDFAGGVTGSTTVPVGATISNTAEAVASLDPFLIPDYDVVTGTFTGDFDGSGQAMADVDVIPFRITKTAPAELLRGVHSNGFDAASGTTGALYTIVVENNPDYAVDAVGLVDTLDPALEFLGCDTYYAADNTTVPEEWPGAGPVATGSGCTPTPTSVDTTPAGETVVTWTLGNLAPGATATVAYRAGIPLYANEPFATAPPAPAGLAQGRNLDNNTGPSTGEPDRTTNPDPELLTAPEPGLDNVAVATGTYTPTGGLGSSTGTHTAESEDIRITKSMAGSLVQGTTVVTTLTIETSEYRDFSDLVVRDLMPSALCFLGTYNVDATSPASDWASTDCAGAGTVQSTINGSPVDVARVRELPGGGPYGSGRFELVWDFADADNAILADLDADGVTTITYSAVVRDFYRGGLAQLIDEPVLAGDSVTNEAEVSGPDTVADASLPPDPIDPDGGIDGDTDSAGISNGLPSIDKRVSVKSGPLANGAGATSATCGTSYGSITWAEGDPTPELGYGPGDIVCFEVGASFPANVDYEGVTIQDLLPAGHTYINGSASRVSSIDTLPGTTITEGPSTVTFTVSGSGDVEAAGHEFRWVLAAELLDNSLGQANDIKANLQKMVHNNNSGLVYQHRDQAAAEWTEPEVRLAKGVDSVNAGPSNGPDHDGSLTGGSTAVVVQAGDTVAYRVDVWNIGNSPAVATEVHDVLPAGIDCTDVSAITNAGTCAAGRITWTGLTVPASTGGGDLVPDDETTAPLTLTYDVVVPADVDADQSYVNTAGVASYQADTNTGQFTYYPAGNIDAANSGLENTDAADDPAYLETPAPTIAKTQKSGIAETGNATNSPSSGTNDQATIGEVIEYQVTVTIPEGTSVYDGEISDVLPSGLSWFTGMGLFGGSVANLQPAATSATGSGGLTGGTVTHSAGTVRYLLPAAYTNATGSGDDEVTITFYVRVDDVVGNDADPTPTRLRNRGRFDWNDVNGNDRPDVLSPRRDTYIVEPNPQIAKDHTAPAATNVLPGDVVTFRITVTNPTTATNVSPAHDLTIVDTVPAGLTPLGPGAVPVSANGDPIASSGLSPAGAFNGTWSETNRTITWAPVDWAAGLDRLDPTATTRFTYDVGVDDPAVSSAVLTNTAALTAYSLDQNLTPTADPNATAARSYNASDADAVTVPVATIVKDIEPFNAGDPADDRSMATVGEPVDYELAVTIPANTIVFDATLFDDLPAELDFDSFETITIDPACEVYDAVAGSTTGAPLDATDVETFNPVGANTQRAAWFLGDLFADSSCEITARYIAHVNTLAADTDVLVNSGQVKWNDTDLVATQTPASLPAGFDDPGSASWTNGAGPMTQSFTVVEPQLEIDVDVTDATLAPLANPTCDTTAGNNSAAGDDPDGTPADGCDTSAGSELRYTLTVSSVGSGPAHDATVVDTVPIGLTPLLSPGGAPVTTTGQLVTGGTGSVGTWDQTARTITWTLAGPYLPSTTVTVDYDVTLDASDTLSRGGELTETVDVPTYHALSGVDRTQIVLDNPANDDVVVYGNSVAATRGTVTIDQTTVETHFPQLSVVKSPSVGFDFTDVRLDQGFSWYILVTNTDAVAPAYSVDAVDLLPEGWTYDPGSARVTTPHNGGPVPLEPGCAANFGSCGQAGVLNSETLTWTDLVSGPAEPLDPGATIVITLTATPQSAALTPDQVTGESSTGYDGGLGPAHTNDVTVFAEDATGSTTCCDPDLGGPLQPVDYGDHDTDDVFIARADIEVDKAVSPLDGDADPVNGPYWFGSWVNYTITVDNLGPDEATGVAVSDVLNPAELEFDAVVSADQGTFDDTTNVWTAGTLADGASAQLVLRTRLVGLGSVVNIAQSSASDQYDSDSTPGNSIGTEDDQDSVSIEVVPTSLGDYVWLDLDGGGDQDPGEPGIPGVRVVLSWADPADGSPQSYVTTTLADGSYGVPPAVGLPSNTDITVTIDTAASPNLVGLTQSFDRDAVLDDATTEQVTTADTTLPSGAIADLDFDFGYEPDGLQTIGDVVWWDQEASADATNGVGEPGVPNVVVEATWAGWDDVLGNGDDVVLSTLTSATGAYSFPQLPPGEYSVAVDTATLPPGLDVATYDLDGIGTLHTVELTLDPAETQADVDFSYRGTGSLGDLVWFDHDGDGSVDLGEPGLGSVTVTASWDGPNGTPGDGDDVVLSTVTSTTDGGYGFQHLPHGDYVVSVSPPSLPGGMVQTFDDDGIGTAHTSTATIDAVVTADLDQDFGYRGAGSIGDAVFFDVDGAEADGTPDTGDAAIAGTKLTVVWAGADGVFGNADDFTTTDTTSAAGAYAVADLPHGSYTVTVDDTTLPAGLDTPTFDADGTGTPHTSATVLDATTPSDIGQDFAYTGLSSGSIGDKVWYDQDADGVLDAGEVGFSGVTIDLTWAGPDGLPGGGDDVVQTTVTDPDGDYLFDNLPDGNYTVTVRSGTLPSGLTPSFDADGIGTPHSSAVSLSPATPFDTGQDFAYTGLGGLGDLLWLDVDGSAGTIADPGEPGIPGVGLVVTWTNPQGADVTFQPTTDSDGLWNIDHLPDGDYTVTVNTFTLPSGLTPTYDADGTGTAHTTAVSLDGTPLADLDQDFSYTGVGSIGDTVWFDQDADGAPDPAGTGVFDGQDQPLVGIDLTVTWGGFDGVLGDDPGTPVIDESMDDIVYAAATDAAGEWTVGGLPHGPYSVVVDTATLPSGITVPTHDGDGVGSPDTSMLMVDTVTPDNTVQDFSYTGLGSLGDTIWFDRNGDGVFDAHEVPLAGVTVTLDHLAPDGITLMTETAVTAADGTYTFENLPLDVALTVTVDDTTLPPGFVPVFDADGVLTPHGSVVTLTSPTPTADGQDFGYAGSGSLGDLVWLDLDASGGAAADLGEPGIPSAEVLITWTNPTGAADMAVVVTTDTDGRYQLAGLPHGDYVVQVDTATLPRGTTPTFDTDGTASPHTSSVTLDASGPNNAEQDFSYRGAGSIGDTVWADLDADGAVDLGESGLSGAVVELTHLDPVTGLTFVITTTTDGAGSYLVDHLPAGGYTVEVDPASLAPGNVATADLDGVDSPHRADLTLGAAEARADVDFGYRQEADLALTKSHSGDFVIGEENTWTLEVTNAGPAAATAPVTIVDTLPSGTGYVISTGDDWDCAVDGMTVTCTFVDADTGFAAALAPGATSTLDITVDVEALAATEVTNEATVTSPVADPDTTDNTDDDVASAPLSLFSLDKRIDGQLVDGERATYVIAVTNLGPSPTRGDVTVVDDLPLGLTHVVTSSDIDTADCEVAGAMVTCANPDTMHVGDVWTIEIEVDVDAQDGTTIVNEATVSGGNDVNDAEVPDAALQLAYEELTDPDSGLADALGIAPGATDGPDSEVGGLVVGSEPGLLAFSGASSRTVATVAAALIAAGFGLVLLGRRRSPVTKRLG